MFTALSLHLMALPATVCPVLENPVAPGPIPVQDNQKTTDASAKVKQPPKIAARAIGQAAAEGGLLAGKSGIVTDDEVDDRLIWREAKSPSGQAALRQLLELRVIEDLGAQGGVKITKADLAKRIETLDRKSRATGTKGGLAELMTSQGVSADEFREYLRLSMIHETLTRRALGLGEDAELTADMQTLWLQGALEERTYTELPHPYDTGVVAKSGELEITRADFADQLRKETSEEEVREICFLILLERAVIARMPELGSVGVEAALDREVARRSAETALNPKFQGASYEQMLIARGLSLEAVRKDPAVRAAAFAHEAIDRKHTDEGLRAVYEEERNLFDSSFGEAVEVRILFKNASARKDDPLRPFFDEVEAELSVLRDAIESPKDFLAAINLQSEDRGTRDRGGLLGNLTRSGDSEDLAGLRRAAFEVVDGGPDTCAGKIVGPVRLTNGVVLAMLGDRTPAPTWAQMSKLVHQELRRRFLEETLSPEDVASQLDAK